MPFIVELVFDGEKLIEKKELAHVATNITECKEKQERSLDREDV